MKAKVSKNGFICTAFDLDSSLGRLTLVNPELAQQRIQEQEVGINSEWNKNPFRIIFEKNHFLYDRMFYIYALRNHQGGLDENINFIIDTVTNQAKEILNYLTAHNAKNCDQLAEQLRWEFLIGAYMIVIHKLGQWKSKQFDPLKQSVVAICRALDYRLPMDASLMRSKIRDYQAQLTGSAKAVKALENSLLIVIGSFINFTTTVDWNNTRHIIEFPTNHPLYHDILEIFAVAKYASKNPQMAKILMDDVQHSLSCITQYLVSNPNLVVHEKAEQMRWSFLLVNLAHLLGACKFYQLCELPLLLNQIRDVMLNIKPIIKSNHKLLKRYYKILELDLNTIIGIELLEQKDFVGAELNLSAALHLAKKYLVNNDENRQSTLFMLNNLLSQLHLAREDFIAAEVQYDNAMRHISSHAIPGEFNPLQSKKLIIIHFDLARHYQQTEEQQHELRTLRKAIEVCDLFLERALVAKLFPDVQKQAQIIKMICQKRLAEIEPKIIESKIKPKTQRPEKEPKIKATQTPENTEQDCDDSSDSEEEHSYPLRCIPISWNAAQKRVPKSQQKKPREKPKQNPTTKSDRRADFFSAQERSIPERVCWYDNTFGELCFEKQNNECNIIVMRDEHNCGAPVFGYLCSDLIAQELNKHYQGAQVDIIMKEMRKTFSEAKQAGFFGRGIKSCPNLPLLNGTDYKMVLKPGCGFEFKFRLYGRTLHNGKHTLFIFNAIDVKPKGAASKLVILQPAKQAQEAMESSLK